MGEQKRRIKREAPSDANRSGTYRAAVNPHAKGADAGTGQSKVSKRGVVHEGSSSGARPDKRGRVI